MQGFTDVHDPVMRDRIVDLLRPALSRPGAVYVDGTLGLAGHAIAILEACPEARLVGIDRDLDAHEVARERLGALAERATLVHAVYDELPEVLDDLGLGKAITALCERLGAQSGVDINCAVDAELPQLAPEAELVAYRVAQEALTNTLRHSGAEHAALVLERDGDDVLLTIADDGRGIGDDAQPGSGIQGMRERALLIGARLRIDPGEPSGTVVRLRLDGQPYGGRPRPHETLGYG